MQYTVGQEQDIRKALQLFGDMVRHLDRIATALETLNERDLAGFESENDADFYPGLGRVTNVELPDDPDPSHPTGG